MYSIHNRDDLKKFKKLQETKSLLHKERLKEKLGKQDFHYEMEEVFEPVTAKQAEATENQKQLSGNQIQASERILTINQPYKPLTNNYMILLKQQDRQ